MDRDTAKIVKRFARRIKEIYSPERIILFGSRARGDNFKSSDFDFIIVSKKFAGKHFIERIAEMYEHWDEDVDIEVVCYTPEEFRRKSKQYGIIRNAIEEGVEV